MNEPNRHEQAAIDAISRMWPLPGSPVLPAFDFWLTLLRTIPLDYCVQRAIGEGAFIPMARWHTEKYDDGTQRCNHLAHHVGDGCGRTDGEWAPLYRLASENE